MILQKLMHFLAQYLENALSTQSDNWWAETVVNKLSFHQQRQISEKKITSIDALDLAALIRVFDQNWYEISFQQNLNRELRNIVKEMQSVRNRWAHASSQGVSDDDQYRDLDTIQRFAQIIQADTEFVHEIAQAKKALLSNSEPNTSIQPSNENKNEPFQPGQMVHLKSDPNVRGAVVSITPGEPEARLGVFLNGNIQTYYASQLMPEEAPKEPPVHLQCNEFHCYLTARQIQYPALSTLYSLNAARVDFIPYQFRPVLRFIRSDRPRMLIADSVGVGKTIEAGLILRELQARRDMRSILIICPRPLVTERKWISEMKRFEERFVHLDGPTLRYCINEMDLEGFWPEQYQRAIVPYSLFDSSLFFGSGAKSKHKKKGLLELDPPPRFDLVIVDEAHHIRNQNTYSHKAVSFFCDHAEAVIFLTATPIQLGDHDLFVLLNTLRPDLIIDRESFEKMSEPNPFINKAVNFARLQTSGWEKKALESLDKASETSWGQSILKSNPDFNRIKSQLSMGNISLDDRVQLISDIELLHTFSGIINRTRRRDIGQFTIRKPETINVPFTVQQEKLHNELLDIQKEIFCMLHNDINVKFMMTTIRRQAASSIFGLVPFLDDILNRHIDKLTLEETDDIEILKETNVIDCIASRIQKILNISRNLDPHDPKLDALRNIIRDKQSMGNTKVMVFSSFLHTLRYLNQNLQAEDFRVGMIHGGTADEDRVSLRNRFEMNSDQQDSLDVLLFSEIGCEGLDYQFCDCIVNYDLPWNPMRVEQRIGRIDRNGQKSESVVIYNLITPNTIDADIYVSCLNRIGVFKSALGGSEEILGEITREIRNIAENFSLNEKERRQKLQQLADNKIRDIKEQEALEEKQLELFGIQLPQKQMNHELKQAASFWLLPQAIMRLVQYYLQHQCGSDHEYIKGDKALKTLRLSQSARKILLDDFHQLPRQNMMMYREWEKWLKDKTQRLTITFAPECASENPKASFIMPHHPLVKQAATAFHSKKRIFTGLRVTAADVPKGQHEFAIYQWHFRGLRNDMKLQAVTASEILTRDFFEILEQAENEPSANFEQINSSKWDELDTYHHKIWSEARKNHQHMNQQHVKYQKESLTTSHQARILLLQEQLHQTTDDKIQRMRQSQFAEAEADYEKRMQSLDIAMEKSELTAEPIAYGILINN